MAKAKSNKGSKKNQHKSNETGKQSSRELQTKSGDQEQTQTGISRREKNGGSTPFTLLRRFGEEMDRIFEDFGFGRAGLGPTFESRLDQLSSLGSSVWSPQVELLERDNQLLVRADLPGMTKDDIDVDIDADSLIIRGERKDEREEKDEGYYRTERSYGSFYRRVALPEGVNAQDATADFRNGVLEIKMPMTQKLPQKQRRLEIGDEAEGQSQSRAKAAGHK